MIAFSSPLICSGEGLTLEMSALATFFGDQIVFSTRLIPKLSCNTTTASVRRNIPFFKIRLTSDNSINMNVFQTNKANIFTFSVYVFLHGKENLTNES